MSRVRDGKKFAAGVSLLFTIALTVTAIATAGQFGKPSAQLSASIKKVNAINKVLYSQTGKDMGAIASKWPPIQKSPCSPQNVKKKSGPLTVGYAYASKSNPWQVQNALGGTWYLTGHPDVGKLYTTDGQENPSKQISDIESLIAKKVDVLVVNPATTAVSPAVRQACMRGIITVVYDRYVTAGTPFTASMYANEVQDGYNGGQAIVKALKGKGTMVFIPGIAGAGVTEDRVAGAKMALAKAPGIKILGLAYSDWDPAKGRRIMEQFLTKYPHIDAVWSDSGVQAVGIVQAIQAAHRLNDFKMIVGGQENGFLKQWNKLKFHGFGSTISTDVGILGAQMGLDIGKGRFSPKANVPGPLVVISDATLKRYVEPTLPDSYWATQVLPKSVSKMIFKGQ